MMNGNSVILKNCNIAFKIFEEQIAVAARIERETGNQTSVADAPFDIWLPLHFQAQSIARNAEAFFQLTLRIAGAMEVVGLGELVKNQVAGANIFNSYRVTFRDGSQKDFTLNIKTG